ncbi:MAG TPA: chemotaxis protein CheW [Crinalium sp.]|jgi:positive phototaxis protein PixI
MSDSLAISTSQSLPALADEQPQLSVSPVSEATEEFLRLHLVPDTAVLLPVQQLSEVLNIPARQIVPIPHLPTWVMGVYNWRGEILWVVDLGALCGLTPWHQQPLNTSSCTTVVLQIRDLTATSPRTKDHALGLVVNRVEEMEWCDPQTIQRPPLSMVPPGLAPFLRGYWWKSNDEMLVVLNGDAIMQAMPNGL